MYSTNICWIGEYIHYVSGNPTGSRHRNLDLIPSLTSFPLWAVFTIVFFGVSVASTCRHLMLNEWNWMMKALVNWRGAQKESRTESLGAIAECDTGENGQQHKVEMAEWPCARPRVKIEAATRTWLHHLSAPFFLPKQLRFLLFISNSQPFLEKTAGSCGGKSPGLRDQIDSG